MSAPNPANVPADIAKIEADEAQLAADTATLAADAAASVTPVTPPPVVQPLLMGTVAPRTLTVGVPYSFQLTATGGIPPYAFTVGGLGPGESITGSVCGGVPTTAEENTMNFTVTDSSVPPLSNTGPAVTFNTVAASVTPPPPPPPVTGIVPVVPATLAVPTKVVLDDEFTTGTLNTSLWAPVWFKNGGSSNGTIMESSNVSVGSSGLGLTLTASKTGGLVSSDPSDGVSGHTGFQIAPTVGNPVYVEFKATIPASGNSIANWPALWLDGQTWPEDGEIDVMEGLGGTAAFHIHYGSGSGSSQGGNGGGGPGTHTYGVLWTTTGFTFVYDGKVVGTLTESLTQPQYIIMENSGGSSGGPSVTPATMTVRYVRVWHGPTAVTESDEELGSHLLGE